MRLIYLGAVLLLLLGCAQQPSYQDRRLVWWDCVNDMAGQGARHCSAY